MLYIHTKSSVARLADGSPAYVVKLRKAGVLSPIQASDGTYLHSDRDIEIVRARVLAWRNRPRKAAKGKVWPASLPRSDGELRPSLAGPAGEGVK